MLTNEERIWCIGIEEERHGSFLTHFAAACLHADSQNLWIVRAALKELMVKYPLRGGGK